MVESRENEPSRRTVAYSSTEGGESITAWGAPATTVAAADPEPPGPLQVSANVAGNVAGVCDDDPLVASAPDQLPLALHDAAFVVDQESVVDCCNAITVGRADNVTVGGGGITVTVTACWPIPPGPVQTRE